MDSITTLFAGNFTYAFAWTMIHSLWQCTLVALALGITLRITRNHSASLRYLQGIFALTICVIVSGTTFFRYYHDIVNVSQTMQAFGVAVNVSYTGNLWEKIYNTLNNSIHLIVLIWVFGFSIQLFRYTQDIIQTFTLKHNGCENVNAIWAARIDQLAKNLDISKEVSVRNSCRVTSACIVGHFKPIVLLPFGLLTSLPADQVEALLLHELAHIKRNDYLVNAIQCFVRLLYFFNPAVLWISLKIDAERENACDDIAVKHCGNPTLYANSLANISELEQKMMTVLAAKKSKYQILPRIKRLFSNAPCVSKGTERIVSAVCACMVILAMNVSAEEINFMIPENAAQAVANESPDIIDIASPIEKPVEFETTVQLAAASDADIGGIDKTPTTAPLTKNQNRPVLSTQLKSSSEVNYASKLLAMNELNMGSELKKPANTILLADASLESSVPKNKQSNTESYLEPVNVPGLDQFLVASEFQLPLAKKIYLKDVQASFAKDWLRQFTSETTRAYRKSIVKKYADTMRKQLEEALIEAGWEVVKKPGENTVLLSARLLDIYINQPEKISVREVLITTVGRAGIELSFQTSDAKPFLKMIDHGNTRGVVLGTVLANRGTNHRYFKMLMSNWADVAAFYLNELIDVAKSEAK